MELAIKILHQELKITMALAGYAFHLFIHSGVFHLAYTFLPDVDPSPRSTRAIYP